MSFRRAVDVLDPSEAFLGDALALGSTFRRAHELLRGRYSRQDLAAIAASIRALLAGTSPSIEAVLAWGKRESRRPRATLHSQPDGCAVLALLLVGDASMMLHAPLPPLAHFRGNLNDNYRQWAYEERVLKAGRFAALARDAVDYAERFVTVSETVEHIAKRQRQGRSRASKKANDARHSEARSAKEAVERDFVENASRFCSFKHAAAHYVFWLGGNAARSDGVTTVYKFDTVYKWIRSIAGGAALAADDEGRKFSLSAGHASPTASFWAPLRLTTTIGSYDGTYGTRKG